MHTQQALALHLCLFPVFDMPYANDARPYLDAIPGICQATTNHRNATAAAKPFHNPPPA